MANPLPAASQGGPLVAQAVERMVAAKLGVGLPPLALLGLYGLVQWVRNGLQPSESVVMLTGAVLSMVAMVAYGLLAVSMILEKSSRWDGLASAGGFVPFLFTGYVIVTRILYVLPTSEPTGLGPIAVNLILLVLAAMCGWAQWKLIEVHLLAREMVGVGGVGLDRRGS